MKKGLLIFAVLFFSVLTISAQNQKIVDNVSISLDYRDTPIYSVTNNKTDSVVVKGGKVKWLVITVDFLMPANPRVTETVWYDDLTVEASLIIPTIYNGKQIYALLSGSQELWSVPADGATHAARLVVPPVVFERYYKTADARDKEPRIDRVYKDFYIKVVFKTKDQRVIGVGYYGPRRVAEKDIAKEFSVAEQSLGVLKLPNTILAAEKTPWGSVEFDRYDLPKIQGGNN